MADIFIATSINSKIFFEENPSVFDDLTTRKLLDIRADIRNEYNTIIVGGNTIKKDNPTLLNIDKTNIRVIIDKYADLNLNSKIFTTMPNKTYLILLKKNKDYEEYLLRLGVNIIHLNNNDELEIIKEIKKISIGKILIEGGAKTIRMFLRNNFIDYIRMVQFPIILPLKSLGFDNNIDFIVNCKLYKNCIIDNNYIYQCYKVGDKQ